MTGYEWKPIEDLPENWQAFAQTELRDLALAWRERAGKLKESKRLREFNELLSRQWAIETGIIERIYTIDRGITEVLIEKGIEASLIPHGATDKPATQVVSIIHDQKEVIDGLFDFVAKRLPLSTSYIKQIHQVFTRNQPTTDALDQFGNLVEVAIVRGSWKTWPNNPKRPDGEMHQYCPPEQVASEMDRLIALHVAHTKADIAPEVEAAWLHHRFTQIHPFQDGNGRVARALASLIFLREEWFPLVITNDLRSPYIDALEMADKGNLEPLVSLFARVQTSAFRTALGISEEVAAEASVQAVIAQGLERLREKKIAKTSRVFEFSKVLENLAFERFGEVAGQLDHELKQIDARYRSSVARSDVGESDHWFYSEIIKTAKSLGYYANLRTYRTWVQLKIAEERNAKLVISFHGLGVEFFGLMAVSAFLEFREAGENNEAAPEGPYTVCTDLFQFSYRDDAERISARFNSWLEEVILISLEQWRKQL